MPIVVRLLLLSLYFASIERLAVLRADSTNLIVISAVFPLRVENRMDVESGSARSS